MRYHAIKYWEHEVETANIGQSANSLGFLKSHWIRSTCSILFSVSILTFNYHLWLWAVDAAGSYWSYDGCSILLQEQKGLWLSIDSRSMREFHHTIYCIVCFIHLSCPKYSGFHWLSQFLDKSRQSTVCMKSFCNSSLPWLLLFIARSKRQSFKACM